MEIGIEESTEACSHSQRTDSVVRCIFRCVEIYARNNVHSIIERRARNGNVASFAENETTKQLDLIKATAK